MLTAFDKALLNIVQTDLPLEKRPFEVLAKRLDVTESEVLDRLRYLKENGYIRRFGPFFDSARLGYKGTLVALKVQQDALPDVAQAVNAYPGITHNYEREGEYNLWFALLAPDMESQTKILRHIASLPGVERLMSLPATKKYKVSVQFKLR